MFPKVSVIVPVYNTEEFLPRCLDSIINQTLKEIEIICINDGSKGNALEILEEYASKDSRIKIINQENSGISKVRNKGVHVACGEFIAFVDSDDTISENFLELLYTNAKKYDADIACGEINRPNDKSKLLELKKEQVLTRTHQKYQACHLPTYCYIWNKIYNREKLLKVGYDFPEDKKCYEDVLWTHIMLDSLERMVTVPNAVYNYYVNGSSLTMYTDIKYCENHDSAFVSTVEYIARRGIKMKNFDGYMPKKRIRVALFGIRLFDLKLWDSVKILSILGIRVLTIYINNATLVKD